MPKTKRQHKVCAGCESHFTTFRNYDYCANCAINGSRYIPRKGKCPECGDGSGWVKFPGQPKRPCKLCVLIKKTTKKNKKLTKEEIQEQKEENFWNQVNLQAQEKIYHLFTTKIPFQNIPLINEPYRYEDAQQKKVGLFLRRDVDYRTSLVDLESQWYERVHEEGEKLPSVEIMAEEIALRYCRMVMKSLITDLSDYSAYDPSFFSDLTTSDY